MQVTAQQIAAILNGKIIGNPNAIVYGPAKIEEAAEGNITFLANPKYKDYLKSSKASVILIAEADLPTENLEPTFIIVDNVYAALAILMDHFNRGMSLKSIIAGTAVIHESVKIGQNTAIDDYVIIKPNARIGSNVKIFGHVFIGDHVSIGDNTVLYSGVKIYHDCVIGRQCVIHANTVIGCDGFGFAKEADGRYKKIAQTGNVIIEDDVEIGSNVVVDRASMGSTIIRSGVKLDNLIQVAHNVSIGSNTAIAAQAGIAGSTQLGSDCLIGGQVGIVGHLQIANGTMIQAQSGVASSVKSPNSKLYGTPAISYSNYLKSYAYFKNMQDLVDKVNELQSRLDKMK